MNSTAEIALAAIEAAFRNCPRATYLVDPEGRLLCANKAAGRIAPTERGMLLSEIAVIETGAVQSLLMTATQSSGPVPMRLRIGQRTHAFVAWRVDPLPGGETALVMLKATPAQEFARRALRAQTVTHRAERELSLAEAERERLRAEARRLRVLADIDRMTGLLNASAFADRCRIILRDGGRGILAFADLDRFKPVNDRFGHEAGDFVIATIARRLKQEVRQRDMVGRLGGDEFGLWFDRFDEGRMPGLVARLTEEIERPILWQPDDGGAEIALRVSASIGWAVAGPETTSYSGLRMAADSHMYSVKGQRGGLRA
ncbi:GGDEF domain-containing protein [Thetidibacter halocola]|uniref:GGDEF domain-containing protein n=1 Tax=Thetidibacter halocola TaxID=2827239 RepID=A0A8J7WDW1_9RHOB|nr:GGDEF domain-containing protein [Thetidibacter halocola]MBS0123399.1 GGDEF domain-containing protein [Thetidibacter halocola]